MNEPSYEQDPGPSKGPSWLAALPEEDRDALQCTWELAGLARDASPGPEIVEAACGRFWDRVAMRSAGALQRPARRAASRSVRRVLIPVGALVLLGFGVLLGVFLRGYLVSAGAPVEQPQFMVLIRSGDFEDRQPAEQEEIVSAFVAWARDLDQAQQLLAGDQLATSGQLLVPEDSRIVQRPLARTPDGISGYFVITAEDYTAALAIARTCPHLAYGGSVEVWPIVTR